MKLHADQIATLNGLAYQVHSFIGSGAVSDVYLATLTGAMEPAQVVIKLVRDQVGPDTPQAQGARMEMDVLTILNRVEDPRWANLNGPIERLNHAQQTISKRRIVALIDSGIDADGRVFLIQELAPPAFRRLSLKKSDDGPALSIDDERALISVAEAIARVIELAHGQGFALKDFEPRGEKIDRIRVDWDAPTNIKLIDWNVTAGPNTTDAEKATDLLYLGGHLYYFFTGEHHDLNNQPPTEFGQAVGSGKRKGACEGSRQIMLRLLQRRYRHAREVRDDLSWWLGTLALTRVGDLERRVRLAGERADRKLAVADLALRLELNPAERERFEQVEAQARRERDRADRMQLDQGIINLRTGLYRKAVEEFTSKLRDPQLAPELAQLARLYSLQAQFAIWLRDQNQGGSLSTNPVWQRVNRAVDDMQRQEWQMAIDALCDAQSRLPTMSAGSPLDQLQRLAEVGQLVSQHSVLQRQARRSPQSIAMLDQWIKDERTHQAELAPVIEQLREALQRLIVDEPIYSQYYQIAQSAFDKRKQQLDEYVYVSLYLHESAIQRMHADELLTLPTLYTGDPQSDRNPLVAFGLVEKSLLEAHAAATRSEQYAMGFAEQSLLSVAIQEQIDQVQAIQASLTQLPAIIRLIQQAQYDQGLIHAEQARISLPDYRPAQIIYTLAQTGVVRRSEAQTLIDRAREAIRQRTFIDAHDRLARVLALDMQPLAAEADRDALSANSEQLVFRLRDAKEPQHLSEVLDHIERVRIQVLGVDDRNHDDVIELLEGLRRELASDGYGLRDDEPARLEQAQNGQRGITNALQNVARARKQSGADTATRALALRAALNDLGSDPTPRAQQLREDAAKAWLQLCIQEPDFRLAYQLLDDGIILFSRTKSADELGRLRAQALPGNAVNEQLSIIETEPLESFSDAKRTEILANLGFNLQPLSATNTESRLLALDLAIPRWYGQLKIALTTLLGNAYTHACELADAGRFVDALEQLQKTWRSVPKSLVSLVTDIQGSANHLIDALERRSQLEETFGRVIQQVAIGAIGFDDASTSLPKLQQLHDHVAVADLEAFADGLNNLAQLSTAALPGDTDAKWIFRLYTHHDEIAQIERQLGRFAPAEQLKATLDQHGQAAKQQAINAGDRVCDVLRRIDVLNEPDRQQLEQSFWTLAWWQLTTRAQDSEASLRAAQALEYTRAALRTAAQQVRERFFRIASSTDITKVVQALALIRDRNTLFAVRPPTVDLPTNAAPAEQPLLFDDGALATWQHIATQFARIATTPVTNLQPASYSAFSVAETIDALQELRNQLAQLKRVIWPVLFPAEDVESPTMVALDRQAQRLIELANVIWQARAQYAQAPVLETLDLLYKSETLLERGDTPWLLANLRAILFYNKQALEQELRDGLAEDVHQILNIDNPDLATQQLHNELLAKCTSDYLASLVEAAIKKHGEQLQTLPTLSKGSALLERRIQFWKIVKHATAQLQQHKSPVADSGPPVDSQQ